MQGGSWSRWVLLGKRFVVKLASCLPVAVLLAACAKHGVTVGCASGPKVTWAAGGYDLRVPDEVACEVPTPREVRLRLRHPERGETSVRGRLVRASGVGLRVETTERLGFLPDDPRVSIELGEAEGAFSCFGAEHSFRCFLAWCAGEAYCLPGSGHGGFSCKCL